MYEITLTERFAHWNDNLSVDSSNRLVQNVALAGQSSRNGYRYTDEALNGALPLYENKPVFLDHAPDRKRPQDRSTRDLVGSIVNCRFSDDRICGDIRVLDTDSGETFLKLVESETPGVGMSHVVLAQRSADGKTVNRIVDVLSVDVVINPATTSTFRESCDANPLSADDHLAELQAERDRLAEQVDRLQQQLEQAANLESVRVLLNTAGLPSEAVTECFREQLLAAPTALARQNLIQDRLSLVSKFRSRLLPARSWERVSSTPHESADDDFVRLIRGR